jgi:Tryptophan-associated transmembrane protein (Trp_oprn_chp)
MGSKLKRGLLLAGLLVAALVLVCSTQQWFAVSLTEHRSVNIGGGAAAPALAVLALTTLVLIAALSIAGPFFRVVLGLLGAVLGATMLLSAILASVNPHAAVASLVTKATGVAGAESVDALVLAIVPTAWPVIATICGILLVLIGLSVVVTSRAWPRSSRKYSAVRLTDPDKLADPDYLANPDNLADPEDAGDPSGAWDALSGGGDPTAKSPK